jgi:type I restriction enzyme S subunit
MSEPTISLEHAVSVIIDNRGRTCPIAPSGIPLIATNCIKNDRLYPVHENVRFVSAEVYNTWFRV